MRTVVRLGPGGDLMSRLEANRDRIRPAAAAAYLEQILAHGEGSGEGPPAVPTWLDSRPLARKS